MSLEFAILAVISATLPEYLQSVSIFMNESSIIFGKWMALVWLVLAIAYTMQDMADFWMYGRKRYE